MNKIQKVISDRRASTLQLRWLLESIATLGSGVDSVIDGKWDTTALQCQQIIPTPQTGQQEGNVEWVITLNSQILTKLAKVS